MNSTVNKINKKILTHGTSLETRGIISCVHLKFYMANSIGPIWFANEDIKLKFCVINLDHIDAVGLEFDIENKARDQKQIYRLNETMSHWGLNPPP